jgi:UDP-glucuronate decarboxylase
VGPVNIGNPNEMSLRDMAEAIIALCESPSQLVTRPLPPDDPKVRRPDITLARRVLNDWGPQVPVREGLVRTRDYFRNELVRGKGGE